MARFDWLTPDLVNKCIEQSENSFSRQTYLNNLVRGWKWYKKRAGMAYVTDFDDEELDEQYGRFRDNSIKPAIDELVSTFYKNRPVINTYPEVGHPEDAGVADQMDAIRMAIWRQPEIGIESVLKAMLKESLICGLSIGKVFWNPASRISGHRGNVALVKVLPKDLFIDPRTTNTHRLLDARYIIHRTRKPLAVVLAKYGKDAAVALGVREARGRSAKYSLKDRYTEVEGSAEENPFGDGIGLNERIEDYVAVHECWFFNVVPSESDNPLGKQLSSNYEYGVLATMINDKIIGDPKPNPFVSNKQFASPTEYGGMKVESRKIGSMRHPFFPLFWNIQADEDGYDRVHEVMGIAEPMIPLQNSIDRLRTIIEVNANTSANPGGIANQDFFDFPVDQIRRLPSEILRVSGVAGTLDQAIKFFDGQQLPPGVYTHLQETQAVIKERIGLHPGVTGWNPLPGGTSHTDPRTIGAIQEAAFNPLWIYVQELSNTLYDLSILIDGLVQQFYTPGRLVDTSENGQDSYVEITQRHVTSNFRREVQAGTTTPVHDIDRPARSMEMAAITNEAIQAENPYMIRNTIITLKNMQLPYAYDYIELLQEKLNELQQTEQQLMGLGMQQMMQNRQQPMLPQQNTIRGGLSEDELASLQALEAETSGGVDEERVMAMLEQA